MYLYGDEWSSRPKQWKKVTKIVNLKLKLREVQSTTFGANDPPPFYAWDAPRKDMRGGKRSKRKPKEGYVGKAEETKKVLWERGWYNDKMSTMTKDAKIYLGVVLGTLLNFLNERTALQHTVEARGHILVLSPKFYPEVAGVGIQYSWGMSKLKFRRELNDEIPKNLHDNILAFMNRETIVTLQCLRRFARHTRDYCREYFKLEEDAAG
ncbi:unnamed protein product, partial [Ectocarpus sp. 12 AP-2014]